MSSTGHGVGRAALRFSSSNLIVTDSPTSGKQIVRALKPAVLIFVIGSGCSHANLFVSFVPDPAIERGRQDVSFGRHQIRGPKQRGGAGRCEDFGEVLLAGAGQDDRLPPPFVLGLGSRRNLDIH